MANHAVVRTDLMFGTDVRSGLVSVKYMGSGETPTEVDNGNVLKVEDLIDKEREVYKGVTPAAGDDIKDIVLVASVETMYDERKRNLDEFVNEVGKICRGYRLHPGDVFSVTKEAIDGSAAVGNVIELAAGTKLKAVGSATSGSTTVGKVIAKDETGRYTYFVIRVSPRESAAE